MHFTEFYPYQPESESFKAARVSRPDVALTITFEPDNCYVWDGDSPEPETQAYNIKITASKIKEDLTFEGNAYLGGCYPLEDKELDFEVNGYAPQMIAEALEDLDNVMAQTFPIEN